VLVSAALWSEVERGGVDPARRVRAGDVPACGGGGLVESVHPDTGLALADLDLLMLAVSDNAAANVLIDLIGMDAVNALARDLGLEHTVLRRRMMDTAAAERGEESTTCAADMVALMAALARADRLPARACRRVLAALAQSQHTNIIPRRLPAADRIVCCKQGELHSVRHDVGLIDEGGRRVALAVLSAPPADPGALARLAAVAYRHVAVAADSLTSAASGAS
jgi:beta-lactamase class A